MKPPSLLTSLTFGHFANDWSVCALWIIAPAVGIAMDLSPAEVGLLITLVNIGGAVAYFPAGILTDHVSDRGRLLIATFWWVGLGYLLASLAPDFWVLAAILAIAGMGDAAWHPIATGVLAREEPKRRAHVLGIHALGGSFAEVLSPLFVGLLLAYVDWRWALALAGVPALVMAVAFLPMARRIPKVEKKAFNKSDFLALMRLWRTGNALRMVTMICCYNLALMALLSMIPLFLADRYGFGLEEAGIAFSFMLVVGAVTQPWAGKLSDHVGRRPVVALGTLIAGLASLAIIFTPHLWTVLSLMVVAVATLSAIRAAVLAGAVDHSGHSEATTLGLAFVFMDGIGALGAVLAGLAANQSWEHTFALAAAFAIAASAFAFATVFAKANNSGTAAQVPE